MFFATNLCTAYLQFATFIPNICLNLLSIALTFLAKQGGIFKPSYQFAFCSIGYGNNELTR
jgi:hypothetical protein